MELEKREDLIGTFLGLWVFAAFIGMFFEKRWPVLHPFVIWTFRIYAATFVGFLVALLIVAPGVLMAKELNAQAASRGASNLERKLTFIWSIGGGIIFSLLIATAYVAQGLGWVTNIKLWFVALLFLIVMIPYSFAAYVIKKMFRSKDKNLNSDS